MVGVVRRKGLSWWVVGCQGEMTEPLSIRAYARHRGVSQPAVQKAIRKGRLSASIRQVNGRAVIVDVALADQEWEERRAKADTARLKPGAPQPAPPQPQPAPAAPPKDLTYEPIETEGGRPRHAPAAEESPQTDGREPKQLTLIDAQQVVAIERGRKLRMENEVMRGQLVKRSLVAKEAFEAERIIREAMLNLPVRIAGELAAEHDAGRVQLRLDAAIREALNRAADQLEATVNG